MFIHPVLGPHLHVPYCLQDLVKGARHDLFYFKPVRQNERYNRFEYRCRRMRPAPRVPEIRLHRIGAATSRFHTALSFFSRVALYTGLLLSTIEQGVQT